MARELDGTEIKELVRLIQRRFDKNEFSAFFYMDVDDKVRFDDFVAAQDVWKVQLANFLQYTDRKNLSVALVAALAAKPEMDASEKGWLEKLSSALITAKEPVADNPDERQLWQEASVSRDPSVIEDFLTRFPGGRYTAMAQARADERIADCGDKRVLERFIKKYGASPRRVEAEARLAELAELAELADVDARPAANTGDTPRSTLLDTVSQLPKRGSMKAVVAALALILGGWAVYVIVSSDPAVQPGIDFYGNDYDRRPLAVAAFGECQRLCSEDNRCAAWTYVKPGFQLASAVCYLKNPIPAARNDNCCVSGKIYRPP